MLSAGAGYLGAILLHRTIANPLSTPFWSRCGYRRSPTDWMLGAVG